METKFWEFSLHFPRELLSYFETLKTDLKQRLTQAHCVSICSGEQNFSILFALSKKDYCQNILFLKEKLADIILLFYKPKCIMKSIKNFDMQCHDNVILLDILSGFDRADDFKYIFERLSLIDKMYLSSFVHFKLCNLEARWRDVGNLINENSFFLMDKGVKKELMKFLMQGITTRTNCIKLSSQNGKIFARSEDSSITCPKIYYSLFDFDSLLFAIIVNSPKKIEISNYKNFDVRFIQSLHELFGSKLKLLEGA